MISRASEYAIRALTFMATQEGDGPWLNREIAQTLGLPPPFLTKVLREMASAGLLLSQRGRTGGFRLALPPEEISLFDIADRFDRFLSPQGCILGQDVCSEANACPLHDEWSRIRGEFVTLLQTTTLAQAARAASDELFPHSSLQGFGRTGVARRRH